MRDGCTEGKRRKAYDRFSGYAAHPTPEGFSLISPDMMTKVGPFPNEKILRAALQELVMRLTNAAVVTSSIAATDTAKTKLLKINLYTKLEYWLSKYHVTE